MTPKQFRNITGRTFTMIPEWVRVLLWVLNALMLTFLVFRAAIYDKPERLEAKPRFYIINRLQYPTLDGGGGFVLEYAKDGETQIMPSFLSDNARAKYEHYLSKCGEMVK
jgi:hypothetical protein